MARYLIAHCNAEVLRVLNGALWKACCEGGQSPDIQRADNVAQVVQYCGEAPFDFVVTSLDLAADPTKSVESNRGLEVVKWVRDHMANALILLIAPTYREETWRFARKCGAQVVYEDDLRGGSLVEDVVSHGTTIPDRPPPQNWIQVEIDVQMGTFQVSDDLNRAKRTRGELKVDKTSKARMAQLTEELTCMVQRREPAWNRQLRRLGRAIRRDLFVRRPQGLRDAYISALTATDCHEETTRVRFVVGKRAYEVPFEAILCPIRPNEHWMLQAPLYRAVRDSRQPPGLTADPLFEDEEDLRRPINCLIIDANTSGTFTDPPCELGPLGNTRTECERLDEMLKRNRDALNGGIVKTLSADGLDEDAWPCKERVRELAEDTEWHVVHYVGHSYYDSAHKWGYLFFPELFSRQPQPVRVREFARWFQAGKPRFFYLSSCESAAQDFVFELAVWAGLPAVAGFRWRVDEEAALHYALSFYRHLLEIRCLELAFTEARKDARKAGEQDLTWASATLVIQSSR